MNNSEIIEKINEVLADEFEIDPGTITPEGMLTALTLDGSDADK